MDLIVPARLYVPLANPVRSLSCDAPKALPAAPASADAPAQAGAQGGVDLEPAAKPPKVGGPLPFPVVAAGAALILLWALHGLES
jgi:hypothetical protein